MYVLGLCRSLQRTLLWGWEFFLLPPQPPRVFSIRGLRLYFPVLEPWVVPPRLSARKCKTTQSSRHCLAGSASRCLSLLLLVVWMSICLTPWLSDFHTVRFSDCSGFLSLHLLSFFWLCEEEQHLPTPPSWLEVLRENSPS